MMNTRNLDSKEILGAGFKIYESNCVQGSGFKATGIFVILLSQDVFESVCPETKFQTITS